MASLQEGAKINRYCEDKNLSAHSQLLASGDGFLTVNGEQRLYERWWLPTDPKAALVVAHGYAEHCARYAHVAEYFCRHECAVYGYDQRAHGRSCGVDTRIFSLDALVDDLACYVNCVKERTGDLPVFVLGHSMGGLITCLSLAEHNLYIQGVVLSGPLTTLRFQIPSLLVKIALFTTSILPTLPTIQMTYRHITRDEEMLARHASDPYIFRGKIPACTGAVLIRGVMRVPQAAGKIGTPVLIVHGGADQVVPVSGSRWLLSQIPSSDKELKIYSGLYHEVLNEIERERVMADIVAWIKNHSVTL